MEEENESIRKEVMRYSTQLEATISKYNASKQVIEELNIEVRTMTLEPLSWNLCLSPPPPQQCNQLFNHLCVLWCQQLTSVMKLRVNLQYLAADKNKTK